MQAERRLAVQDNATDLQAYVDYLLGRCDTVQAVLKECALHPKLSLKDALDDAYAPRRCEADLNPRSLFGQRCGAWISPSEYPEIVFCPRCQREAEN